MESKEKLFIFDTTLRDGEQAAGNHLSAFEKLNLARQLARLRVDIIEVGFPASSPEDFKAVQLISQEIEGPVICGLSRAIKEDIDRCAEALSQAKRKRIHTGIGTSDLHMERKLNKSRDEVLRLAVEAVKHAGQYTDDVEFYAEDATRTDPEFLFTVLQAVIEAGASVVNIPDTTGYAMPDLYGDLIAQIKQKVPNIHQAIVSVHCHNDLGLAVANSLAGIRNGARQVECTMNGIGERAGNASLEEIVMGVLTRKEHFQLSHSIQTKELYRTSHLVAYAFGMTIPRSKAIVGSNAFAHSSGIHVDGVLKDRLTYEIINPEEVGFPQSRVILTARTGRHGLKHRLKELGYPPFSQERLEKVYGRFLEVADKKQIIYDEDLVSIMENEIDTIPETYLLEFLQVISGTNVIPTATVKIKKMENGNETLILESALGDGPVDATYKAIDKAIGLQPKLEEYTIRSVTSGGSALGEVMVSLFKDGRKVFGHGSSTDVVEASARAYVNGFNKLVDKMSQTESE
ncbi:MAG: 2-isopropylmalate synthase [bacterium]